MILVRLDLSKRVQISLISLAWIAFGVVGCNSPSTSPAIAPTAPPGMAHIPGGQFAMGSADGFSDESPVRQINISGFFLDTHEVTNDDFSEFVEATGYVTVAERPLDPADFPGVSEDLLKPGALVFLQGTGWSYVNGASWRCPEGPDSNIEDKGNHPVVQVCWEDAATYAKWAGKRLPTEAEWEFAARAGRIATFAIWGDEEFNNEKPQANIWQGEFPVTNELADGFETTAPVGSFAPNPYGLYDMAGNVWEWCADWYRPDAYQTMAASNPVGPETSYDPDEPGMPKRVLRGGSFLCAASYCRGYRPAARMKSSPDTGLLHVGFRCAMNASEQQ